jgi:flagellar hook-associated protein 3 FlgL
MAGRIGNNELTRSLISSLQRNISDQTELREKGWAEKAILRPSDDPTGSTQILSLNSQLQRLDQYKSSLVHHKAWSETTRVQLDQVNKVLGNVGEIVTKAKSGSLDEKALEALAEQLNGELLNLASLANGTHDGKYIFAGDRTDKPAFRVETDANSGNIVGVYYQGDHKVKTVKTRDQGMIELGVLGSSAGSPDQSGVFIDGKRGVNLFDSIISLRDQLYANNTQDLADVEAAIDNGVSSVTSAQARLGTAQQRLELDRYQGQQQNAEVSKVLASVEDIDYATLISKLNKLELAYQYAAASGGRMLQRGLLNYL